MTFSFKYRPARLNSGKIISRPMVPIILEDESKIAVFAMLDSGSDLTIIPEELAEILSINFSGENEVFGISREPVKAKEGRINVRFGKGKEFYNFSIPILVPLDKQDMPIIIGRIGFFNQFKVTFIESEKKVEFKKVETSSILCRK